MQVLAGRIGGKPACAGGDTIHLLRPLAAGMKAAGAAGCGQVGLVGRLALVFALTLLLSACGGRGNAPAVVALALDGPPLAVAGEYAGMALEGEMARPVMAGKGLLLLGAPGTDFDCRAEFNALPSNKGRVRGVLLCSGERRLPVSLRNIGPDQGIGIARETAEGELMVFFYHPSKEEAQRRLPEAREDLAKARAMRD